MITDSSEQTKIRDAILRAVQSIPSVNLAEGCKVTIEMHAQGVKVGVEPGVVVADSAKPMGSQFTNG